MGINESLMVRNNHGTPDPFASGQTIRTYISWYMKNFSAAEYFANTLADMLADDEDLFEHFLGVEIEVHGAMVCGMSWVADEASNERDSAIKRVLEQAVASIDVMDLYGSIDMIDVMFRDEFLDEANITEDQIADLIWEINDIYDIEIQMTPWE